MMWMCYRIIGQGILSVYVFCHKMIENFRNRISRSLNIISNNCLDLLINQQIMNFSQCLFWTLVKNMLYIYFLLCKIFVISVMWNDFERFILIQRNLISNKKSSISWVRIIWTSAKQAFKGVFSAQTVMTLTLLISRPDFCRMN